MNIAEIDMGVNFGSRITILEIKTHFFQVKPTLWGQIAEFDDLFPSSKGNCVTSYLQNWKSYRPEILNQACFNGCNDSYKVSFQSVDVNLDF